MPRYSIREIMLPVLLAADDLIRALPLRDVAWPPQTWRIAN